MSSQIISKNSVQFFPPSAMRLRLTPPRLRNSLHAASRRYITTSTSEDVEESEEWPNLKAKVPCLPWTHPSNQRAYMEWLAKRLSFRAPEDWYNITAKAMVRNHGSWLLRHHMGSPARAVIASYPDHAFLPWMFEKAAKGYFSIRENRLRYVEWLKERVGVTNVTELNANHYIENHGNGLLKLYNGSPQLVLDSLKDTEPGGSDENHIISTINGQRRPKVPQKYWASIENQRAMIDDIGRRIGVSGGDLSPWYKLDLKAVIEMGASGVLRIYDNSLYDMLRNIYPDYEWLPWKFKKLGNIAVRSPDALHKVMRFIELELKLTKDEDWYSVSQAKLEQLGVLKLVTQLGGLYSCLKGYKSNMEWDPERLSGSKKFGGRLLRSALQAIWPYKKIEEGYELDSFHKVSFFMPHLRLGLDYQTIDYYGLSGKFGDISVTLREHSEKVALASSQGISLIFIPFWWDRKVSSLLATILYADQKLADFVEDKSIVNAAKNAQRIPEHTIVRLTTSPRNRR